MAAGKNKMLLIRRATPEDLPALLEIYNDEVQHGTATFDLSPKTLAQQRVWLEQHNVGNHPLIVAEQNRKVAGYASLSSYREKEAYRSTVELSVYIGRKYRRQGIGAALMEEILNLARRDPSIHTVVSVITSGNEASLRLHEKFGFVCCGSIREVGKKFGSYLDISNYQLIVS